MNMESSSVVEIPGLLQNKTVKKITFTDEGINIEKPLSYDPDIFIPAADILAFRFKAIFMRGYAFAVGRQYLIEIKGQQNTVFKLDIKSYYGIKRKDYYEVYSKILEYLWQYYFSNLMNYYADMYNVQQPFELAGVKFTSEGISLDKKNKLLWKEIAIKNYRTYFMIHNVTDPHQNKSCNFDKDWNAILLQSLLKSIIDQQKKEKII